VTRTEHCLAQAISFRDTRCFWKRYKLQRQALHRGKIVPSRGQHWHQRPAEQVSCYGRVAQDPASNIQTAWNPAEFDTRYEDGGVEDLSNDAADDLQLPLGMGTGTLRLRGWRYALSNTVHGKKRPTEQGTRRSAAVVQIMK
jgi:hypothetical protein